MGIEVDSNSVEQMFNHYEIELTRGSHSTRQQDVVIELRKRFRELANSRPKLAAPTIHPNGTSRAVLCESLEVAVGELRAAIAAVQGCFPNGRDYYPQSGQAICVAQEQHTARMNKLCSVRDELAAIWETIAE